MRVLWWVNVCVLLAATAVRADEVVGYVKTATPKVYLTHNQQTETAQPGSAVYLGTLIKTDAEGSLGVTLKDNTLLSFGPDTEFTMDEFVYNPAAEQLKLDMRLVKGTLHYISGVIAKLKPSAVSVKTPTGIIGVRGTRFVVKVEE